MEAILKIDNFCMEICNGHQCYSPYILLWLYCPTIVEFKGKKDSMETMLKIDNFCMEQNSAIGLHCQTLYFYYVNIVPVLLSVKKKIHEAILKIDNFFVWNRTNGNDSYLL